MSCAVIARGEVLQQLLKKITVFLTDSGFRITTLQREKTESTLIIIIITPGSTQEKERCANIVTVTHHRQRSSK